jgi:hypothetical protein
MLSSLTARTRNVIDNGSVVAAAATAENRKENIQRKQEAVMQSHLPHHKKIYIYVLINLFRTSQSLVQSSLLT